MRTTVETIRSDSEVEPEPADCIVVLGRGIEYVEGRGWRPTTAIERLSEQGWHPGIRERGLTPDSEGEIILAGSNANIYAAVELFEKQSKEDAAPSLVIFAAGRPNYLMDNPDPTLSEGCVMNAKFQNKGMFLGFYTNLFCLKGKSLNKGHITLHQTSLTK